MKLTVVIISYNEKEYLRDCIKTCLQLPASEMEVIFGDDGSSDGSIEEIESIKKEYPEYIIKSYVMSRDDGVEIPSIRVSNNIKHGIGMAGGKYIVCISGDDFFSKEAFKKQIHVLESDVQEKYSACVSRYRISYDDGRYEYPYNIDAYPSFYWGGVLYRHLSCFMFRKKVFDDGYFLEHFCDDTGLHFSMAMAGKWYFLKDVTFDYRQRSGSIMHSQDKMEQDIADAIMLQDTLDKGKLRQATLSRFEPTLLRLFKNRKKIVDKKYQRYLRFVENKPDCILSRVIDYDTGTVTDKMLFRLFLLHMYFVAVFYQGSIQLMVKYLCIRKLLFNIEW